MAKYQFHKSETGEAILIKDGIQTACPFVPPLKVPHPQIQGASTMMRVPCSTTCPLCELNEDVHEWEINCGKGGVVFKVEPFIPEEPKSAFSIV